MSERTGLGYDRCPSCGYDVHTGPCVTSRSSVAIPIEAFTSQAFRERRERIATAVLGHVYPVGFAMPADVNLSMGDYADVAVSLADALMARLDRDPSLEGK